MSNRFPDEEVLVVPNEVLGEYELPFNPRNTWSSTFIGSVDKHGLFMPRNEIEEDERYRQVIPYVVLTRKHKFLLTRRTEQQSESRLHGLYSLGIGGHVNTTDLKGEDSLSSVIINGMYRELNEELSLQLSILPLVFSGIINDKSTQTGRVHLGIVFLMPLNFTDNVEIRETENMTAQWCSKKELEKYKPNMENWSKIVYEKLLLPMK